MLFATRGEAVKDLVQPHKLRVRIKLWADQEIALGTLPSRAGAVLEALLYRGALPRSEVADVLSTSPRTARRIVSALIDQGVVTSDTPKSDLRITFPARLAPRWMPGLFPELPG